MIFSHFPAARSRFDKLSTNGWEVAGEADPLALSLSKGEREWIILKERPY